MSVQTTILHVNSSARIKDTSLTRRLGSLFFEEWKRSQPGVEIINRDVGRTPIPAIDQEWITAAFTKPEERSEALKARLALSDELIDEVERANIIVMGVPMYNYSVPASLKGWIDHVARIGRTFSFDPTRGDFPIEPILSGKILVILSSRGEFGFSSGGVRAHLNGLDPTLHACAHYFGVSQDDIHSTIVEYQEFKDDRHSKSIQEAEAKTREMVASLLRDQK